MLSHIRSHGSWSYGNPFSPIFKIPIYTAATVSYLVDCLPSSCTAFSQSFAVSYDVTTRSVTYPGELRGGTFSLGPRDPKRIDRDENRGLGTRQVDCN